MDDNDRQELVEDYTSGTRNVWELEEIHGIGRRRIEQIVEAAGCSLRKQPRKGTVRISDLHRRIGVRLIDYRYDQGLDAFDVSNALGITKIRYARIENGTEKLELLDLQRLAGFLKITVAKLIEEEK